MGWLTGGSESKQIGSNAFLSGLLSGSATDALYPEPSFASHATAGFTRNELVYACVMEKATSLPEAPLRVYGADGMGEPRENHALRRLMANPNPLLTEFEMFELTVIHLDLAGNAFWEIVRDRANRPVELWPLRPDLVRIFPGKRGAPTTYGYDLGNGRIVDLGADVVQFRYPNPMDPYLGQPPMRSALRATALDNEATDFVKALLQNRATPATVIETEQKLDEEVSKRLTAKWTERFGGNRRGLPAFLQKGMKVHTLGLNLKDLEFPDLRTISESRICMSFGVPPILVGAKIGLDRSTFANYAEARSSFWEETLMPLQTRIQQTIVKKLLPMVESGPRPRRVTVRFDNSQVRALRESEGKRWELATQALRAGGITVAQFARYAGLPVPADADVYLRPAGVIPTDAAGNPTVEVAPNQGPTAVPAAASARRQLEMKAVTDRQRKAFAERIAEFAETQRDAVLEDLQSSKSHILTVKAWDAERWDTELSGILRPEMTRFARAAAHRVDADADVSVMDNYISTAAANTATAWNTATRQDVEDAARSTDWTEAVNEVFSLAAGARAINLAGSLATEMDGFGAVDTAKHAGLRYKTWVVNSDNSRHDALAGERVLMSETFSNGARWPGDAILPDDERVNCQCSVIFEEGN